MKEACKFCKSQSDSYPISGKSEVVHIECPICGKYDITHSAKACSVDPGPSNENLTLFSSYLRNETVRGVIVFVDSAMLRNIGNIVALLGGISFDEKIDNIVRYLGDNTKQIGNPVSMENAYPLFYLHNFDELSSVLDMMTGMGLGKTIGRSYVLGAKGWQKYDEIKTKRSASRRVFIAMSFNTDLLDIFTDAVSPACKDCDLEPIRVDRSEHNEKICDKIITEIKRCKFVVADFTDPKYGVYFEAGYAQGLGIPVIWTCKKTDVKKLHFDTRQYNHIIWDTTQDLKEKLVNRIRATIL